MFHVKHEAALQARDLIVGYGRRDVVEVESLDIRAGEVTAILGPNAAGKSTLVRALAGALRPRRGGVQVGGAEVYGLSARVRAERLAFVAQQGQEQFAFTVRELVELGAQANPKAVESAATRMHQALAQLDLLPLAGRDLLGLSGGERQRASLARALAQATTVLVLDEPTAHLDLKHQAALMAAVRNAAGQGAAVVLVLHDLNLASAFADRIILLSNGRIVADGTPDKVLITSVIRDIYQTNVYSVADGSDRNYLHLLPPQEQVD